MYHVIVTRSIERSIRKLPKKLQERLLRGVYSLEANPRPHGAIQLAGNQDLWRIRVGDYRIVYQIDDARQEVTITLIAHRREVYRDL
jgi:mRNA interferase RelE/StbE